MKPSIMLFFALLLAPLAVSYAAAPLLKFEWSGPGIVRQLVPVAVLSHVK